MSLRSGGGKGYAYPGEGEAVCGAAQNPCSPARARGGGAAECVPTDPQGQDKTNEGELMSMYTFSVIVED